VTVAEAVHRQAEEVAVARLRKARGLLASVAPAERRVIEETAYAVAAAVAECLLDEAEGNALLRDVLENGLPPVAESPAVALLPGSS